MENPFDILNERLDKIENLLLSIKPEKPHVEKEILPEWMSRQQVRDYLNISIATVDNWTRQGKLKKHFVGGVPRFKRDEVRKIFESL